MLPSASVAVLGTAHGEFHGQASNLDALSVDNFI
jgi:hypothetical protein